MARYATTTDLLRRMSSTLRLALFDDDHSGAEDTGLADTVLDSACDEVDASLQAAGFEVPLSGSIPPFIRQLTLEVAWVHAHNRIGLQEQIKENADRTAVKLEKVSRRELWPGLDPAPDERDEIAGNTITSATRVFGRDNLSGL